MDRCVELGEASSQTSARCVTLLYAVWLHLTAWLREGCQTESADAAAPFEIEDSVC